MEVGRGGGGVRWGRDGGGAMWGWNEVGVRVEVLF